jgi:choline dehydrogenase-like flavoprotein
VERWLEVGIPEPKYLGMQATIIARGADALGLAHGPLLRNAPGCDGQGLCYFGCPTGAKRSADVSLIPAALAAGAMLYTHARVDGIAATREGVELEARAPSGRALRVRARTAIVAAGSLVTPLLLAKAGCRHAMLGRNLSIHPAAGAVALFPFAVDMEQAIPQGYGLEGLREQGLLFEGGATPFELTALALDVQGPRLVEILEQHHRLLTYGFNVRDTSRGRVRRGPGGAPLPTYRLGDGDVAQLQFGMRTLLDLLAAGGATTIFPPVYGLDEVAGSKAGRALDGRVLRADDLTLSAYHPLGTARMGRDPATSVVDMELRVRGLPSLMVCDGSAVPTSMGANPQITIMALAARAAERLAARLG